MKDNMMVSNRVKPSSSDELKWEYFFSKQEFDFK